MNFSRCKKIAEVSQSFQECLQNFLSNLYSPPRVRKSFKFMIFTFLRNALNLGIFTHASPLKNSPQVLIITTQAEEIYSFPWAAVFRSSVSHNSKKDMVLILLNLLRNQFDTKITSEKNSCLDEVWLLQVESNLEECQE